MRFETTILVKHEDIEATVNPGNGDPFATVEFGGSAYVSLRNLADCDQLIRAAVDAKRMLQAYIDGTPHPFASDKPFGNCTVCGTLPGDKIHAEPSAYDRAIQQARFFAQPGNTIEDVLAKQQVAS